MTGITKITAPIELSDLLEALKREIFLTLNCIKIGQIQSFDPVKKTAEILIQFKRILSDNTIQEYFPLLDCPVFTLQGGGGSIQFPVAKGDDCIVLFSDRSLEIWLNTGVSAAPNSLRTHALSDAIAIVGVNSLQSSLAAYTSDVVLTIPAGKNFIVQGTAAMAQILGDQPLALKSDVDALATFVKDFVTAYNAHNNGAYALVTPFSEVAPTIQGTTNLKGS